MTDVELVIALRGTESRSKRALLDEAADRLEQLATERHKRRRTRQAVFLARYPYAELDNEGYVRIKPCALDMTIAGYLDTTRCGEIGCVECRRNYWMGEAEI